MHTKIHSIAELPPASRIEAIRAGILATEMNEVRNELGITQKSMFEILGTSERNALRLLKENRPLDPAASERLLRLVEVENHAVEVFGNKEKGIQWMTKFNPVLQARPVDLLDTETGHNEVRRVLIAIAYGLPV